MKGEPMHTSLTTGAKWSIPFALSTLVAGMAFGLVASRIGFDALHATLMSATAFSGTAQLTAVQLWGDPLPIAAILLAAAAVNGRYIAMGAMLRGKIERHSAPARYTVLAFLSDAGWALAMRAEKEGLEPWPVLLACSILTYAGWVGGTFVGGLLNQAPLGSLLIAAQFLGIAMLSVLLPESWKKRADLLSCGAAVAVALLLGLFLPGSLNILAGGISGALVRLRLPQ